MRIDSIEVVNLRFEYAVEDRFRSAGGECDARVTSLVLVQTDTGEVGVGSTYSHPGLVYLIVRDQLAPMLRGEDPAQIDRLWEMMYRLTRWYGRKGAALSALGGVDMALWDLLGKAERTPVWRLLGARQGTCPVYASALLWKEDEALAQEAVRHIDDGFRRVKMRLGRSEERDIQAVQAVRRAVGWDNDVIVDASMRYHLDLAQRVGRSLSEQKVFWYEEPFAPEDIDAYAGLRGTIAVPVAAGENEFGMQGFAELIRAGAVDIVQPDASRCGGISEVRRVGQLAGEHGLRVATHSWSDAVAILANAHVVAALPNGITVEMDRTGNPFVDELLVDGLSVEDGQLQLGENPGLGLELNREVVDRFRVTDPLRLPDGAYSDMVFGKARYHSPAPYVEKA